VTRPLSKAQLAALEPEALDWGSSLAPTLCRFLAHFRQELGGRLEVYLPDTQGPFDLAHLARGHDLLIDLVDDPPFVHHLMELATHVYIEGTRQLKQAAGEPLDGGHHGGNLYMVGAGVRVCDDSGTLLSPRLHEQFVLPYQQRALEACGGGWVHWCGGDFHLVPAYLSLPAVKGINLGQPDRYDLPAVFQAVLEVGKLYYGPLPRGPQEDLSRFFTRVLGYLQGERRGLILTCGREESMTPAQMMNIWHEAH
jgi:uroporphyrinogen-III decarboxylase